jgi:hypothetical protein
VQGKVTAQGPESPATVTTPASARRGRRRPRRRIPLRARALMHARPGGTDMSADAGRRCMRPNRRTHLHRICPPSRRHAGGCRRERRGHRTGRQHPCHDTYDVTPPERIPSRTGPHVSSASPWCLGPFSRRSKDRRHSDVEAGQGNGRQFPAHSTTQSRRNDQWRGLPKTETQ